MDYILLQCGPTDDVASSETHQQPAVLGLEVIRDRWAGYARRTSREQGMPIEEFATVTIDRQRAASMIGTRISRADFLGPRYGFQRNGSILPGGGPIVGGYAYAFSDPPYTLNDYARQRRVTEDDDMMTTSGILC